MTTPISRLLSQALIAFTIEVDNQFEQRLRASGEQVRVSSLTMWFNFLRHVGEGITVGELPETAGLQKARTLSTVGGMERWGYVQVGPGGERDGYGSARGLRADWIIKLTSAGRLAATEWPRIVDATEKRWAKRFGSSTVAGLVDELKNVDRKIGVRVPDFPPILGSANGLRLDLPVATRHQDRSTQLVCLLARALLSYAVAFELRSGYSLALWANVVRLIENQTPINELPRMGGISPEAVNIGMTVLKKAGRATVESKKVRLTDQGLAMRDRCRELQARLDDEWSERSELAALLRSILEGPVANGLRPDPDGWRNRKPYLAQTEAMLEIPTEALPHYPMVLYRGGWPDGS